MTRQPAPVRRAKGRTDEQRLARVREALERKAAKRRVRESQPVAPEAK